MGRWPPQPKKTATTELQPGQVLGKPVESNLPGATSGSVPDLISSLQEHKEKGTIIIPQ